MTTTDEDIERRLAHVESTLGELADAEAAKSMHRSYLRCLGDRDFARMAGFLTEDAVMDLRAHGADRGARP